MQNRIAHAIARIGEIGHGPKHVACFGKRNFNGIIKPTASQHFKPGAIRFHPPNSRCFAFKVPAVFGVNLESMTAIGKIKHAVRAHNRSVQTGSVCGKIPTFYNGFPEVSHAIAIGIGEFVKARRSSHIEAPVIPDRAGRQRQLVSKHG